jgi:hypothetical protein
MEARERACHGLDAVLPLSALALRARWMLQDEACRAAFDVWRVSLHTTDGWR